MKNNSLYLKSYGTHRRIIALLISLILAAACIFPARAYANPLAEMGALDEEGLSMGPLREVHNIKIKNKKYCFFAMNNVVLTTAEIASMSDEELVETVIMRSQIFMKTSNCNKASSKVITPEVWMKKGSFWLDADGIKSIRSADPKKGEPVKLHMNLKISTEKESKEAAEERRRAAEEAANNAGTNTGDDANTGDGTGTGDGSGAGDGTGTGDGTNTGDGTDTGDSTNTDDSTGTGDNTNPGDDAGTSSEEGAANTIIDYGTPKLKYYSTYKKTGEELIFVIVALAPDASDKTNYCKPVDNPFGGIDPIIEPDEPEEMLPEYRTIEMLDRSGGPIPAVLLDGSPVTLTWQDVKKDSSGDDGEKKFAGLSIKHIAGLALIVAFLIALIAIISRRLNDKRRMD